MQNLNSEKDLDRILGNNGKQVIMGFFGDFSAAAKKAKPHFEEFCEKHSDHEAVLVDVGKVKGIHKEFGVSTVPTVLMVKGRKVVKKVVGIQSADYYERALLSSGGPIRRSNDGKERPSHRVVLYVGDACPWCAKARNYLRQRGVPFREVNVSRDERMANELVKRSGNRGVPQLDIDGNWIVGFNRPKIDSLLGLSSAGSA